MVRSEFYNGASLVRFYLNKIFLLFFIYFFQSTFSVFIDSRLLICLFSEYIHPYMDEFLIWMLYYTTFYEMTHRPLHIRIIYHWYSFSFFHPFIYLHILIALQLIILFVFLYFLYNISVAIIRSPIYHILIPIFYFD